MHSVFIFPNSFRCHGEFGARIDGLANIEIPYIMLIDSSLDPMNVIVDASCEDLLLRLEDNSYLNTHAIVAPTIAKANQINDYMCGLLPGDCIEFLSCDSVCNASSDSDSFKICKQLSFFS